MVLSQALVQPRGNEGLIVGSGGERFCFHGPTEGLCHGAVEVGDEGFSFCTQLCLPGEIATTKELSRQDGEPDFDLVEPRGVSRREMEGDAMLGLTQEGSFDLAGTIGSPGAMRSRAWMPVNLVDGNDTMGVVWGGCGFVDRTSIECRVGLGSQPIADAMRLEVSFFFKKRPTERCDMFETRPRRMASSAISRWLQWLICRSLSDGFSHVIATKAQICSAVNVAGAPVRGASAIRMISSYFARMSFRRAIPSRSTVAVILIFCPWSRTVMSSLLLWPPMCCCQQDDAA